MKMWAASIQAMTAALVAGLTVSAEARPPEQAGKTAAEIAQERHLSPALYSPPDPDAVPQLIRLEGSAVKEDRRGAGCRAAGVERVRLLAQEPCQVPGNRRVGRVWEADLGQAHSAPARRHLGRRAMGEEAVEQYLVEGGAGQLGFD